MQTYDQSILATLPRAYHLITEASGATMADSSGNGLAGTYYNTPTYGSAGTAIAGRTENGVTFTAGSLQYASFSTGTGFMTTAVANGGISVSFWFKHATGIPMVGFSMSGGQSLAINRHGSLTDLLQVTLNSPTTGQTTLAENFSTGSINVGDGSWHHIVVVFNFAAAAAFAQVDGIECTFWGGSPTRNLNPALLVDLTTHWGIAGQSNAAGAGAGNLQSGSYNHHVLWDRMLTPLERRIVYEDGVHLYTKFTRVPKVFTRRKDLWAAIGKSLRNTIPAIECHVFGDSTSTIPGGNGGSLLHFSAMIRALLGVESPASQWIHANSADGLFARTWPHSWTDVSVAGTLPPGVQTFESVSSGNPDSLHFDVVGFSYQSEDVNPASRGEVLVPETATFEVIAQRKASSGALFLTVLGGSKPFGYTGESRFTVRPSTQLFSSAELNNADGAYVKKSVNFKLGGYQYLTAQLAYNTAGAKVALYRMFDPTKPGLALSSFSAGGYKSDSFVTSHNNCGPLLAAIGAPAFIWLDYGTNDENQNVTAATFKANMVALIANLRAKYGSPQLPVILTSNPILANRSSAQKILGAEYAAVLLEIAQADDYVAFLNVRRVLYELGWNHDNNTYSASAWAASTAYSVGNQVSVALSAGETWYFRCISAHTSSASGADRPPNAAKWVRVAHNLIDGTHYGTIGVANKGGAMAALFGRLISGSDYYDSDVASLTTAINNFKMVAAR